MSTALQELYQELILDHGRNPHNRQKMEGCSHQAHGFNPLCGDDVTVFLSIKDGQVVDAAFDGKGCAISVASASLMTDSLKGKTIKEVKALFAQFHGMVTGDEEDDSLPDMGKLTALAGVRHFPMRVKCATLPWHTLEAALNGTAKDISTE